MNDYPLHVAIGNKDIDTIITLVNDKDTDINLIMPGIGSPLQLAIRYHRSGIINFLLAYRADPNTIIQIPSGNWHVLDDFYDHIHIDIDTLNILFKYGANPYLTREKACKYLQPYFWKFVKQKACELVIALPHLSAVELIAILEGMCSGADQIPYYKKWALVKTKHLKN